MPGLCTINGDPFYTGQGPSSWVSPSISNSVLDISLTASTPVVTLAEMKEEMKIDFSDEDAYITDSINLCQAEIETMTGTSLGERTVQAILCNYEGDIEIPYGPIQSITSIVDQDGNDLTSQLQLGGINFKWLITPTYRYINITYVAGYTTDNLPLNLKKAVKMEVAFRYRYRIPDSDQRANVNAGICEESRLYANPFKRNKFI